MLRKLIKLLGALFTLGMLVIIATAWSINNAVKQRAPISAPELLVVESGQTVTQLVYQFQDKGWIENTLAWRIYFKLNTPLTHVQTGTYEVSPNMPLLSLFSDIATGNVKHFSITLVEGLNWRQWQNVIANTPYIVDDISSEEGTEALLHWVSEQNSHDYAHLEGLFLPDTYLYTSGTRASQLLKQAHQRLIDYLSHAWDNRATGLPVQSEYEALILASIVEKETGVAYERPLVAGVFMNRLEKKMRLQTDPTVIYGIGEAFDGNITRKHLRTPTPYNTYVIKGLPPTPISMVGHAAIDAVMHPDVTDALYFVSKGDGSHHFSETLDEHNQAVRKYQLKK
ncbi:endolytic transglycosylase MltG [Aestuariibacter sp. AA17]|uniref:Endolytic murein transglycosylase n=1 Tax=Fluctibacter corallii TaxID=2984329 RepID=A0ABT3A7K7_9ALTE|nr:endolytic transglycosylase MltG [Aestuariibacter sp. AA17]MCV2884272.1 endolytic transglycosylase MltG [Aestuariibacter sp. AA17]